MPKYEITETIKTDGTLDQSITRFNDDGSITLIPMVENNSDYQAYLESLKESK